MDEPSASSEEMLTMEEIEARYPSEWVLIGNPETDEQLNVKRGTLLCHSRDRETVEREAIEEGPAHLAVLYVGDPVPDMHVIL